MTTSPVRVLRSSLRLSVPLAVMSSVVLAAPAMADLPEAWETPESASFLDFLVLVLAIPVGVALVITLLAIAPALARGEKLTGHHGPVTDDWFGGPRGGKRELKASGSAQDAGGASGTW